MAATSLAASIQWHSLDYTTPLSILLPLYVGSTRDYHVSRRTLLRLPPPAFRCALGSKIVFLSIPVTRFCTRTRSGATTQVQPAIIVVTSLLAATIYYYVGG